MSSFIQRFFPTKAAITSTIIRAEIDRAETEIASLHAKLNGAMAGVAVMSDSEHIKAEADSAATRRAIARLDARVGHLTTEFPAANAAEDAAAKAEADAALIKRTEECRKANSTGDAVKWLKEYQAAADKVAEAIAKLQALDAETAAVNAALRSSPVAESVESYHGILRKHPDQQASERTLFRPGRYEDGLGTATRLPPAFVGPYIWPRS